MLFCTTLTADHGLTLSWGSGGQPAHGFRRAGKTPAPALTPEPPDLHVPSAGRGLDVARTQRSEDHRRTEQAACESAEHSANL
jgi:hypothetical protein